MANKTINEFLDDTVKVYGFTELSPIKRRELRFKLALAEIKDFVATKDTSLALDLVLEELQPKTSTLKTASAFNTKIQPCPRCNTTMGNVKLSTTLDAMYCQACHVCVPIK